MPKYKNSFATPAHLEEEILDEAGKKIGTIRVKPVSILWKPKGQSKFFSVDLETFTKWIIDPKTRAAKTDS